MVLLFFVFFLFLLLLTALNKLFFGPEWAGLILGAIGIIITLTYQEVRNLFKILEERLTKRVLIAKISSVTAKINPLFSYADLIVFLLSSLLLCLVFFNAFSVSIDDMVKKGFLSFPKGDDGFIHLQTYLAGFVFIPTILIACGSFGFFRGFKDRSISFLKLFFAILIALLLDVLIIKILSGDWYSSQNYALLAKANPQSLPMGAIPLAAVTKIGLIIFGLLVLSSYTWVFGILGKGFRGLYEKLKQEENSECHISVS